MTPNLTLQDRLDIEDAQSYLKAHAGMDWERMPEGSLAGVFNQLSPAARTYLKEQQAKVANFRESGGREMPFQPKRYLEDLNLPEHAVKTLAKADTDDGIRSLHERMGTGEQQAKLNDRAPDIRDTLTAAFDAAGENDG
jgi:hypothetical protein